MTELLWRPDEARVAAANLTHFRREAAMTWRLPLDDHAALYRWSIAEPAQFWQTVWSFCGVVAEHQGETALVDGDRMPGARFFPEARLNFAANLLRRRDQGDAVVFWGEDRVKRRLSRHALYALVARLAQALARAGIGPGDRVAGFVPNLPETLAAMLAAASLGAIWSSCSPDFGVQGVVDRFGQTAPKLLFFVEGCFYNGKAIDCLPRL